MNTMLFAEVFDQIVKETTGLALRVTSSIADKDSAQTLVPANRSRVPLLAPKLANKQLLDRVYSFSRRERHNLLVAGTFRRVGCEVIFGTGASLELTAMG